jgi:hypothetical protein
VPTEKSGHGEKNTMGNTDSAENRPNVVLIAPAKHVKQIKTMLEHIDMLDKSKRITSTDLPAEDIQEFPLMHAGESGVEIMQNWMELQPRKEKKKGKDSKISPQNKSESSTKKGKDKEIAEDHQDVSEQATIEIRQGTSDRESQKGPLPAPGRAEVLMSIPVKGSLGEALVQTTNAIKGGISVDEELIKSIPELVQLITFWHADVIKMGDEKGDRKISVESIPQCRLGIQTTRLNKALGVSAQTKATNYLNTFIQQWGSPPTAGKANDAEYPRKYEIVGDILVVPEDSFQGLFWEPMVEKIDEVTVTDCRGGSDSDCSEAPFWKGLARCFGVEKVARKAKVDSGPKRESHVVLLQPPLGRYPFSHTNYE